MKPHFCSSDDLKANQLLCYYFKNTGLFDCSGNFREILSKSELGVFESKIGHYAAMYRNNKVLLRLALGNYMRVEPGLVEFDHGSAKPKVKSSIVTDFNISHSGNNLAVVIACSGNTGVDLEFVREIKYRQKIAARLFSYNEQLMLAACKYDSREFIRLWTMKEAAVKCSGHGMYENSSFYDLSSPEFKYKNQRLAMDILVHEIANGFISLAYTAAIESVIYSCFDFKSGYNRREALALA